MGLSHVRAAQLEEALSPTAARVEPERGHKRGQTSIKADRTDAALRGVPVIGHGAGAISLTSPGGELGQAARLEQAGRDIVRLHRKRFKAQQA